jgi:hypothetical protein
MAVAASMARISASGTVRSGRFTSSLTLSMSSKPMKEKKVSTAACITKTAVRPSTPPPSLAGGVSRRSADPH